MPVDLHQRLSEFSYGYGVTREIEQDLRGKGLRVTPFLPSLIHEASLGFDVAFDRPGKPLLLQFKLGEVLKRFRRTNPAQEKPDLSRPFWRFEVDTAEAGGQYDLLLRAEQSGAEVHYVAPRFTAWDSYLQAFMEQRIRSRSLFLSPLQIDQKLASGGEPDGPHRVLYDRSGVYVLSDPVRVEETIGMSLGQRLREEIKSEGLSLGERIRDLFDGLGRDRDIRAREQDLEPGPSGTGGATFAYVAPFPELGRSPERRGRDRAGRHERFQEIAEREEDALFATVGVETWAAGMRLIAATVDE